MRGSVEDGDVPVVASDIPVELVVIWEETQGVRNDVANGNGVSAVIGNRNVDLEVAVLPLRGGFVPESATVFVDALHGEGICVIEPAWTFILDGNITVNAVPRAAPETERDVLGYIGAAVGGDDDVGVELSDFVAALREDAGTQREEEYAEQDDRR